jgi:hypothetical protein
MAGRTRHATLIGDGIAIFWEDAMRCSLYSTDGPLMSEGMCEIGEQGITMATDTWHTTPQEGMQPLSLIVEGGKQYFVRVDNVHIVDSGPDSDHREQYRLTRVDDDAPVTVVSPANMQSTPSMPAAERDRFPRL